jgi:hypothetical protein
MSTTFDLFFYYMAICTLCSVESLDDSVNDELECIWKEAILDYFKLHSYWLPGGTEKSPKKLSQFNLPLYLDSSHRYSEYETGMAIAQLRR